MPVSNANVSPPSVSDAASEAASQTSANVSRDSGPPADATTALTIGNSVKRCLRDASLAHSRLEILSLLDFKPLYSGGTSTLAGELFDLRVAERNADLESVVSALQNAQGADGYTAAKNQYDSVLVATESDFALMKLLLLLQKYATHTSRFMPFLKEYTQTGSFDALFLGDTTVEKLEAACSVNLNNVINEGAASQVLLQALASIGCCTYGVSPYRLATGSTILDLNQVLTGVDPRETDFINALYGSTFISRDLTFSREMSRIANGEEPDPAFQELVESLLGSNFATSAREIKDLVLEPVIGTSNYSNLRMSVLKYKRIQLATNLLRSQKGIVGSLRYSDNRNILLPEKSEIQYNTLTTEFEPIDQLVDEAFSGANILDFTNYSNAVNDMTTAIDNSMLFLKTGFRILESADDSDGSKPSIPVVSSEQPLSPSAVAATIFDVFNRRFASSLNTSLMTEFYDWQTPEHVNYTKVLAWLLIRDNPTRARRVVNALLNDYDGGYLTALAVPEPIEGTAEVDDEGEEIAGTEKMTELVYVKPGTETRVTLGGGAALNSQIKRIGTYYADDVPNMSPSNVLSKNPGEGLSKPEIRTNSNRIKAELREYFGSPNTDLAGNPDLRLINVISMYQERYSTHSDTEFDSSWWEETESTRTLTGSSNYYYSSKIIAAEIIDAVLEVIRALVTPFTEVEAVEDGDPVFPFLDQMKGPYGDDNAVWGYSGSGYDLFAFNQWVNTILAFDNTFTRSVDKVTYFRRAKLYDMCTKILEIFGYLMSQYDFLQVRSETIDDGVGVPLAGAMKINWPVCATVRFNERDYNSIMTGYGQAVRGANNADGNEGIKEHITLLSEMLSGLLNSSFDNWEEDVDDIRESMPADGTPTGGETTTSPGLPMMSSGGPAPSGDRGNMVPEEPVALTALSAFSEFLLATKEEDAVLSFLCDFVGGYSTRVSNYKTATLDLVEGEGVPMGELINNLRSAGDAGEDTLQNMSSNQMSLKQIAIKEEAGDPENGYLPKLSILTDAEIESVKVMCNENILKSPEGDTTRVVVVGIPVGSFDRNNIESEFCIRVSYRDIEYPQLVFRSKSYKFDKDLYVLPEDLEAASITSSDLDGVIDSMKFSRLTVEVTESSDESAEIQLSDNIQQMNVDNGNRQVYNNIAVSELLKLYYRIMVGLNYSEIAFNSTPEGLAIPISDGSSDLAAAMALQIESLGSFSEGLAANVGDLVNDLPTFENVDDFVGGDITPVDEALLGDLKNAYQSRLFSPETFRSRALGAKMFDRVYAIPVDPDEFYIVAPGESQVGTDDFDVETPQNVLDFYLEKGIVEETGLAAPFAYKLAPRKTAEGSMAFGSVTVSMTSVDDDSEEMLG